MTSNKEASEVREMMKRMKVMVAAYTSNLKSNFHREHMQLPFMEYLPVRHSIKGFI
jgi:hypothetical protein